MAMVMLRGALADGGRVMRLRIELGGGGLLVIRASCGGLTFAVAPKWWGVRPEIMTTEGLPLCRADWFGGCSGHTQQRSPLSCCQIGNCVRVVKYLHSSRNNFHGQYGDVYRPCAARPDKSQWPDIVSILQPSPVQQPDCSVRLLIKRSAHRTCVEMRIRIRVFSLPVDLS